MGIRAIPLFCRLCCYLSIPFPLLSQSPQSYTYTISDGMPMTEVSSVYCDNQGYIWSVYNNSHISRFDGRKFQNYTPEETGHYYAAAEFLEDDNGVWFIHHGSSISLFASGRWHSWKRPFTDFILDKTRQRIVTIDTAGVLWDFQTATYEWDSLTRLPEHLRSPGFRYDLTSHLEKNEYLLKCFDPTRYEYPLMYTTPSLMEPAWTKSSTPTHVQQYWNNGELHLERGEARWNVSLIDEGQALVTNIWSLLISGDSLLIHTSAPSDNGLDWTLRFYAYSPARGLHLLYTIQHPHSGVYWSIDHQGHAWIGSHSGLTRLYAEKLEFRQGDTHMVSGLHVISEDERDRIWLGGYTTGLCYFEHSALHPSEGDASKYKRFLPGLLRQQNGSNAYWTEDHGLVIQTGDNWDSDPSQSTRVDRTVGYCFLQHTDFIAAGFQEKGIGLSTPPLHPLSTWKFISQEKNMLLDNVLTLSSDHSGRLWAGRSSQGIALYDPALDTAQTWLRASDTEKGFGATCSVLSSKNILWFGSHDGLRYLRDPDKFDMFNQNLFEVAEKIHMPEAGASNVTLIKEHKGFLIFGNKHGYGFLDIASHEKNPDAPRIFFHPTDKFLKSPDQNTILVDSKGYVWIGQDLGATRIDFDRLHFDTIPVTVVVDSVLVSGELLHSDSVASAEGTVMSVRLPVFKRHLEIFLSPSFTGLLNDNVGFQYRLIHDKIPDTTWSAYSKADHITLSYLPPGINLVEIRAIKNNEVVDVRRMQFIVPLALSENPWFWICLLGGLSLAGALISWRIYHQRLNLKQTQLALKEKELALSEQERAREQLQIQAITNSLNPHFINNSLQWLQSRVRKDPDAVRMIDRFSKNIRTVFLNSRNGKAHHTLAEEMELVRNYLYIQKSRYGDFVDISMPSDEQLLAFRNFEVPLMQLQIHVENAIEHGIRHRAGARILKIEILENGAYVHIDITDDGIGRARSKTLGSRGTQQGTAMLKSLHAIFNKHNNLPIRSRYTDTPFVDPNTGESYGTTVHIEIPKHYTYELTKD